MRIDKRATQNLPKGVLSFALKLPALKQIRAQMLADLGIPDEVVEYIALSLPLRRARHPARAARHRHHAPAAESYATKIWDYWERTLDPDLYKDRSFEGAVNGKTVVITGASSRHRPRRRAEDRGRGRHPDPRRAHEVQARRGQGRDRGRGRHRVRRALRPQRLRRDRRAGRAPCWPSTRASTCSSTTRDARSGAPSKLSYDRFHDYERTVHLNYLSPVKLMLGLLPHMRDQGGGHIVNVSSIGVQTNPPRFSRLRWQSKAALDAFTRVVSSETIGDDVTFTTIHMPLVRTPMIAPTKMYDSFPTISPEEAADLVCEAIRAKPKQINTKLGTFGEVAYALAPKAVDQILHLAYRVFPESTAAKGGKGDAREREGLGRGDGAGLSDEGRPLVVLRADGLEAAFAARGRDGVHVAAPPRRGAAGRRPRARASRTSRGPPASRCCTRGRTGSAASATPSTATTVAFAPDSPELYLEEHGLPLHGLRAAARAGRSVEQRRAAARRRARVRRHRGVPVRPPARGRRPSSPSAR